MRKRTLGFWAAVLGICLIFSAANGMAAHDETVGVVSFDTTQVFVRLTGPFESQGNIVAPYVISKDNPTPVSSPDWRSGQFPIEAFPNEFIVAHLFFNTMPEQIGEYNAKIAADGSFTLPFRFDVRNESFLLLRNFFPGEAPDIIPGAVSVNAEFGSATAKSFNVTITDANFQFQGGTTYYFGAVVFQIAEIDYCAGPVMEVRDEIQPLAPAVGDIPDRIADMVVRMVPPERPQLVYEDMTKLHVLDLCFEKSEDNKHYYFEQVLPASWLAEHLGWNFSGEVEVQMPGRQGKSFFFDLGEIYPFPPFSGFVQLPFDPNGVWVPQRYTDANVESNLMLKVDAAGLHVSYVVTDLTGSIAVDRIATVILSFSIPSHTFPKPASSMTGPAYAVDGNGNVLMEYFGMAF